MSPVAGRAAPGPRAHGRGYTRTPLRGFLPRRLLGVSLGPWQGVWEGRETEWIRLFRSDASLVPTGDEAARAERQRAETAEAELARLRALLAERKP